jgi:hypothetical protein
MEGKGRYGGRRWLRRAASGRRRRARGCRRELARTRRDPSRGGSVCAACRSGQPAAASPSACAPAGTAMASASATAAAPARPRRLPETNIRCRSSFPRRGRGSPFEASGSDRQMSKPSWKALGSCADIPVASFVPPLMPPAAQAVAGGISACPSARRRAPRAADRQRVRGRRRDGSSGAARAWPGSCRRASCASSWPRRCVGCSPRPGFSRAAACPSADLGDAHWGRSSGGG